MKIVCLGGGPAGVYLAISMKLRNAEHDITVYERNKAQDTFGWGVVFSDPASLARPLGTPLHPTQLYSSAFALLLFGLLWLGYRRWRRFDGQVFLWFVVLYSAGRFLIEFLRNDNRGMFFSGSLSASQVVALPLLAVALIWLYLRGRKVRPQEDGAEPSQEPA